MSKGVAYLDENLEMDYNHLESRQCFCQAVKEIGEPMCGLCLKALEPVERARLLGMKPGEGVASSASMTHNRMWRRKRGWRG
jgi:hypothetical protein